MYGCFKQFGGVANKDLARMLFSDTFSYGGVPLLSRLEERSFVTRNVVHVAPGTYSAYAFRDFPQTAEQLCAVLLARYPGVGGRQLVADYFAGEGCERMCAALQAYGQNSVLYRNTVRHVAEAASAHATDLAMLLVLQFIASGCLGDVSQATEITLQYAKRVVDGGAGTMVRTNYDTLVQTGDGSAPSLLGLCKFVNGVMQMPPYALSTGPQGTEIGSLTTAASAINDVDPTVSKRHLHIFRDDLGVWYAQGLGSTNGTTLLRGDDQSRVVIEPPRVQRVPGEVYPPIQILPNDMLRLAGTTFFMVVELTV